MLWTRQTGWKQNLFLLLCINTQTHPVYSSMDDWPEVKLPVKDSLGTVSLAHTAVYLCMWFVLWPGQATCGGFWAGWGCVEREEEGKERHVFVVRGRGKKMGSSVLVVIAKHEEVLHGSRHISSLTFTPIFSRKASQLIMSKVTASLWGIASYCSKQYLIINFLNRIKVEKSNLNLGLTRYSCSFKQWILTVLIRND